MEGYVETKIRMVFSFLSLFLNFSFSFSFSFYKYQLPFDFVFPFMMPHNYRSIINITWDSSNYLFFFFLNTLHLLLTLLLARHNEICHGRQFAMGLVSFS
jgi:hypothetical protein